MFDENKKNNLSDQEKSAPTADNNSANHVADAHPNEVTGHGNGDKNIDEKKPTQPQTDADKLIALEKQLTDLKDQMLRALADADNTKKRAEKDITEMRKYAPQIIIREILPIFDNLAETMKTITDDDKAQNKKIDLLFKSLELILKMTDSLFEKFYVCKIAAPGQKFDPNLHQALSTKSASHDNKDTIADVLQQGYQLHDRLIRPALVVVYQ
ncbi:MAG: nucleotide exchange factor GrpE [Alphaproteobacteria bacterium]